MQLEVQAVFDAMDAPRRDAVTLALAAAHLSNMPASYTRAAQETDAVATVWRLAGGVDYLRMVKAACGALLDGRVRCIARERQHTTTTKATS